MRHHYSINPVWLIVAFVLGVIVGATAFGAPPRAAAAFTAAQYEGIPNQQFVRWIWNRSGTSEEYNALMIDINTALNHSSVSYTAPQIVAEDKSVALIPVDFSKLADDLDEVHRLLGVWDKLAASDPFFHETLFVSGAWRIRPARHLGEFGVQLENTFPPHPSGRPQLTLPVARGDWIHVKMLSSIDGGQYLTLRGLTPGKTKLEEYFKSRGASFEEAKRLNAVERLALLSHVTGKARGIDYWQGQGVRATASRALVFRTDDIFDENVHPKSNPFSSLIESKPDGHEVFVVLANGWIEFTLWNGDGILVAEAPMGSPKFLVADHRVAEPFAPRLHGAISCLRCHGPHDGYQPAQNEVADRIRAFGVLSHSLQASKQFEQLRKIGFLYQAKQFEIDAVLQDARDGFDRRVFEVTGIDDPHAAKVGCAQVAALYEGYEHVWLDAKAVLLEAGMAELPQDDPLGVQTMASLMPVGEAAVAYTPESLDTMLHLATVSKVMVGGKLTDVPLKITRRQAEAAFPTIALRIQDTRNP